MESLSHEVRIKELGIFIKQKKGWEGMCLLFKNILGSSKELFKLEDIISTRTNGYKPAMSTFRLEIRSGF